MSKKLKQPSSAEIAFNNITLDLQNTKSRCQNWSDTLLRASNQELYAILSACFQIYSDLTTDPSHRKRLNAILKSRNIDFTAGTSLPVKVIRYVFGPCNEEFTYARSLKVALSDKPEATPFADWLVEQGGPAGVKAKTSSSGGTTNSERVDLSKRHYESSASLTTFAAIPELAPSGEADHVYSLALVRPSADDENKVEVVFGTNNVSLLDKVLVIAAKAISDADAERLKQADENTVSPAVDNLIQLPSQTDQQNGPSA